MTLEEVEEMTAVECAKFCEFEFGYGDIDVAHDEVIRKSQRDGTFTQAMDDETHALLSAILPAADRLGIAKEWQEMLAAKTLKALSVAAEATNLAGCRAAYLSAEQLTGYRVYNAARLAYWCMWPASLKKRHRDKSLLRKYVGLVCEAAQ